ncbi:hypothetical protein P8452_52287 [Trifolium repens]|nr:hypothetical protein P8452_52287 [Trifolium repens]
MEKIKNPSGTSLLVPSVQELAKDDKILTVPPRYIQPQLKDPVLSEIDTVLQIPIIDMHRLISEEFGSSELNKLHLACKDWGFFQIWVFSIIDCSLSSGDTLELYSQEMKNLAMLIVYHIGKALKMKELEMRELFEDGIQMMRMNYYYPPCPEPEKVIGLTNPSDPQGITLLLQLNDVAGLHIKKDGMWIPVKPLPNAFIVNIGDIIEILTNGIYRSIEHRAIVNSEKERLSTATFYSPKQDSIIGPVESLITEQNPARFKNIGVEEYFKNFFARKLEGKSFIDVLRIEHGN